MDIFEDENIENGVSMCYNIVKRGMRMKVEIQIEPNIGEPIALIRASSLTPELVALVEMMERAAIQPLLLTAKKDDKSFVIEPERIDIIRSEGGDIKCFNQDGHEFDISKPLHELSDRLGNNFIRISKSTIININRIDHLSPSFNRTVNVAMKNGMSDYVSKGYVSEFKKRLGL
jgi:DNA-binding LytR/AlgR family response regulator